MNPGIEVEVNHVWASNGALKPPSRAWFKGYVLEAVVGSITKVRIVSGIFAGCIVNYPTKDVRPVHSEPAGNVVQA